MFLCIKPERLNIYIYEMKNPFESRYKCIIEKQVNDFDLICFFWFWVCLNSSLFQFDLRFETKTKLDSPRFS